MTDRVEVTEAAWRADAPRDKQRRLALLLLGPEPSSEALAAPFPDRSQHDASGPGVHGVGARRSGREGSWRRGQ